MLLVEADLRNLVEYMNLWNAEFDLNLAIRGLYGKKIAWTAGNELIAGIEIGPGRDLIDFENFNLQRAGEEARRAINRLTA